MTASHSFLFFVFFFSDLIDGLAMESMGIIHVGNYGWVMLEAPLSALPAHGVGFDGSVT